MTSASPLRRVLYLHGFRSSPASAKARQIGAWLARHRPGVAFLCPALPSSPSESLDLAQTLLAVDAPQTSGVIGSSLGGFYATWLAARRPHPTVVLNPAVDPARDLAARVGVHPLWHAPERTVEWTPAHVEALRRLTPQPPWPPLPHLLAVVATGDEVLDWREMWARYEGCSRLTIDGGDHGLTDFEPLLPTVIDHLERR